MQMDNFMDDTKYELAHRYRERLRAAEPPEFLPRSEWPEDTNNDNFCSGEVVDIPIAYARGVVKGFPGLHYLEVVIDGYEEPQIISAKHVKKLGGSDGRVED
jgi:hypothetical protein